MPRLSRVPRFALLLLILAAGGLIGTVLGDVVALLLPPGVVRDVFITAAEARLGPATLDLQVLSITLGLGWKVNLVGVLGVLVAASALRWYSRSL